MRRSGIVFPWCLRHPTCPFFLSIFSPLSEICWGWHLILHPSILHHFKSDFNFNDEWFFFLSPECRVVKSTSYTKIASSSRRSTTKSPGPSRRSKSPASTSSGKTVKKLWRNYFVSDTCWVLSVSSSQCEVLK